MNNKFIRGYGNLDILKLSLALLILLRHIGQGFYANNEFWRIYVINTISTVGVTTFFIISGFLFFQKAVNEERLKKQICRILKLYGVWIIAYFPINMYSYWKEEMSISQMVLDFIKKTIFSGSYYHLWYLPSLIIALYIVYVLGKKYNNKRILTLTGILMIIGILTNTYTVFLPDVVDKIYLRYCDIFLTSRNGLFMGAFLVAVGKSISDYTKKWKDIRIFLPLLIISILALYGEGIWLSNHNNGGIINIAFTTVAVATFLALIFIVELPQIRVKPKLRNLSTLIYCCHPWIIFIVGLTDHFGILLNTGLKAVLTLILTIMVSWVVVKLDEKIKVFKILM